MALVKLIVHSALGLAVAALLFGGLVLLGPSPDSYEFQELPEWWRTIKSDEGVQGATFLALLALGEVAAWIRWFIASYVCDLCQKRFWTRAYCAKGPYGSYVFCSLRHQMEYLQNMSARTHELRIR